MLGDNVSPTEIKAYIDLTGCYLDAWESEAIIVMNYWRQHANRIR